MNQTDFTDYYVPRTSLDDVTPEEWDKVARDWIKPAVDENVNKVVRSYLDRAEEGMDKYGVTTSQNPLELVEWLRHLQEELMDASIYIERTIEELRK